MTNLDSIFKIRDITLPGESRGQRSLLYKRERGEGLHGKQVQVIQGPTLKLIKGHGNWRHCP